MSEHELWNELGNLYFMSGAYDQAAYAYHRSIQLDVGFGRPYSNLALTYVQQGKYEEAVELYRRSIELLADNKEKAISWNRLGNVHRQLKQYHKAVVAYQEADELDPQGTADFLDAVHGDTQPGQNPEEASDNSIPAESSAEADEQRPPEALEGLSASMPDDSNASWTPTDPSQYQEDISAPPEPGSLTTWGDEEFDDDDLDVFPWLEPEPEIYGPDADEDDLRKWVMVPEEEPSSDLEISAFSEPFESIDDRLEASLKRIAALSEMQSIGSMQVASELPSVGVASADGDEGQSDEIDSDSPNPPGSSPSVLYWPPNAARA